MRAHSRHLTTSALVLLSLLGCRPAAAADEVAIIVAGDAPGYALTRSMLRDIYLKKILMDDNGQSFIPVNLPPGNPLRSGLAETLFNKSPQQLQDYWNQRYFQGVAPPYVVDSQEAVLQFVASTPGAIGYIASCRIDARVKQLMTLSLPPSQRQAAAGLCRPAPNGKRSE
jgi:ABC-type phosphate transport system substrate-binding protein